MTIGIDHGIGALMIAAIVMCPLAIWKVIDIVIWIVNLF